eukprot:766437-Rhodomonas_salina.1
MTKCVPGNGQVRARSKIYPEPACRTQRTHALALLLSCLLSRAARTPLAPRLLNTHQQQIALTAAQLGRAVRGTIARSRRRASRPGVC